MRLFRLYRLIIHKEQIMRLASRFGYANQIRRDRPLTHEELMHYVPGIFGEDRLLDVN